MLDEKKLEAMRNAYEDRKETWPYVGNLFECMDTLSAALKVVRAAQEVVKDNPGVGLVGASLLVEALSPFQDRPGCYHPEQSSCPNCREKPEKGAQVIEIYFVNYDLVRHALRCDIGNQIGILPWDTKCLIIDQLEAEYMNWA